MLERAPARRGEVQILEQLPLAALVHQGTQGVQAGHELDALGLKGGELIEGQPLILEADRPAAPRQLTGGVDVVEGRQHDAGGIAGRRIIGPRGLHVKVQMEGHRCLRQHPGQLSAPHNADAGQGQPRRGVRERCRAGMMTKGNGGRLHGAALAAV